MAIDPNSLTDKQWGLASPADQARFGRVPAEHARKMPTKQQRLEKQEQSDFARLLEQAFERGELIFDWSATHKRTTNKTGRADFWIAANDRFLQIEFKRAGVGRMSPEQKEMRSHSQAAGVAYNIVSTAAEAHQLLVRWQNER